ncbi:uncharacterized protein ACA1_107620 [Acanthamoeba castellanii str. Neff]|uniref:EF hand domain containing protein n=1 Tax=Acanthamoeba castellanii (strain ATCC 30010 / Neff) TaxID=1257118 RepID=L8GQD1_ACACF|nr:uncharacterized protein ACA1_107620 [Acanthamoeba castellanii str. Neff]ELR14341.1 hypothetical protein ACA1_107620 [Acanthamoeba castellanii str. Neff]
MGAGESAPVQLELKEGTQLDPVLAGHIVACFKENNEKGKPLTPKRFADVMEQVSILYGSEVATNDYEYLYNLFDLNHDGKAEVKAHFAKLVEFLTEVEQHRLLQQRAVFAPGKAPTQAALASLTKQLQETSVNAVFSADVDGDGQISMVPCLVLLALLVGGHLEEEWVAAVKSNEEVQRFVVPELFLRAFMSEVRQAYTPL